MITLAFTLSIALMLFLPVAAAGLLRRRIRVPWLLFCAGTLTFIASQIVHFPLNDLLMRLHLLPKTGMNDPSIPVWQTALILGLTASLCETTARWVGFRLLPRFRSLGDGLMAGLGHGGIEAMIFGGVLTAATVSSLAPMIGADLGKMGLSADQARILSGQLDGLVSSPWLSAAGPLVERLLAMCLHVVLSLLVMQGVRRGRRGAILAAAGYHWLVDSSLVYASTLISNHYLVLIGLAALLLPGMGWALWMWRREGDAVRMPRSTWGFEMTIFLAALRKELLQQWRTRRVLVVMTVFILFGLTSPLVARFMPEIFKSIPGAEQFAGLIPAPTFKDAMSQYIKNITQFGFLLAVLLGMNAVAGEKESGTAAMILSKPMPRWAFILSKFFGQSLVYLAAFAVASLGAYYYTLLLFGSFDAGTFAAINLLLLLWLLAFVGAALLGSVIGGTTAAAGGFGIAFAAAIMLAGSIPQFGQLLPAGLMAWASMLGEGQTGLPANGGALAGTAVWILVCLLWSIALFERQEI